MLFGRELACSVDSLVFVNNKADPSQATADKRIVLCRLDEVRFSLSV